MPGRLHLRRSADRPEFWLCVWDVDQPRGNGRRNLRSVAGAGIRRSRLQNSGGVETACDVGANWLSAYPHASGTIPSRFDRGDDQGGRGNETSWHMRSVPPASAGGFIIQTELGCLIHPLARVVLTTILIAIIIRRQITPPVDVIVIQTLNLLE